MIPSVLIDVPIPTNRIPRHKGTDLAYIRQLADESGYVFYLEPGPAPGMNIAYWGPEIKVGVPQPALNIDMDAQTNVESLSFNFNAEAPVLPIVMIQNQRTKVADSDSHSRHHAAQPAAGRSCRRSPRRSGRSKTRRSSTPIRAALLGLAKAAQIRGRGHGSGTLDVLRYGRLLQARELVGVRGAGTAFDGLYYVKSVTHNIKRGEYKQSFTLTRNGLISTVPRVPA